MDNGLNGINRRVAEQVLGLRTLHGHTLQTLAQASGVSRSMISLIERGKASPTAVVLERLATALGVPLAHLFDPPGSNSGASSPLARRRDQAEWQDPGSGYLRRNISPPQRSAPFRIVEVEFPAGARVAFETAHHEPALYQQVWVLAGQISITVGDTTQELERGDCLAMSLDQPVVFSNLGRKSARYAVVIGGVQAGAVPIS
jgi:transcriptional regulator with XRE-family HTH domain